MGDYSGFEKYVFGDSRRDPRTEVPELPEYEQMQRSFNPQAFKRSYGNYDAKAHEAFRIIDYVKDKRPEDWAAIRKKSIERNLPPQLVADMPGVDYLDNVSRQKIIQHQELIEAFSNNVLDSGIIYQDIDYLHEIVENAHRLKATVAGRSTNLFVDVIGRPAARGAAAARA